MILLVYDFDTDCLFF